MLLVPYLAGVALSVRAGAWDPVVLPLLATWLVGYFAFNAVSLWLKAAPARRGRLRAPLISYAAASAAFGLVSLALAGWGLLGWVIPYAPLLAGALVLAGRRNERAVLGGALTVAAACLMTLVCRFPVAADVVTGWGTPAVAGAVGVALVLFGYFFGTVLYVKTMIRERGRPGWLAASVGWHVGCLLVAVAAWGASAPGFDAFFALAALRSGLVPWIARRRPVTPRQVGLVEVAMSVGLLALVATP